MGFSTVVFIASIYTDKIQSLELQKLEMKLQSTDITMYWLVLRCKTVIQQKLWSLLLGDGVIAVKRFHLLRSTLPFHGLSVIRLPAAEWLDIV